jgi:hypothetical protein
VARPARPSRLVKTAEHGLKDRKTALCRQNMPAIRLMVKSGPFLVYFSIFRPKLYHDNHYLARYAHGGEQQRLAEELQKATP